MKTTKEIVIKRTGIEYTYDDDDKLAFIDMRLMIYVPGDECATLSDDEDAWEYNAKYDSWICRSHADAIAGLPYGLAMFLGIDNEEVIKQTLDALAKPKQEFITVKYDIEVDINSGHNLPTCGQCKHWNAGHCNWCDQALPADHVIPCGREVFTPSSI